MNAIPAKSAAEWRQGHCESLAGEGRVGGEGSFPHPPPPYRKGRGGPDDAGQGDVKRSRPQKGALVAAALAVVTAALIMASPSPAAAVDKIQSLCQYHYPSDLLYDYGCVRLTSGDSPWGIFRRYWRDGLRFNRMDRRHFIAGVSIKVPRNVKKIKDFTPMPEFYPEAEMDPRFILVDQDEMFLGAYQYGNLVFSTPIAAAMDGYRLKNGLYRVDAVDPRHESSLYLVEGSERPYPMHYGLRFYTEKRPEGWTTYWLHGRDVPGYPASHGCIGLYDEEMQKDYYNEPEQPLLMDAKKLYEWVVEEIGDTGEFQKVKNGPKVLIVGEPPMAIPEPGDSLSPPSGRRGVGP